MPSSGRTSRRRNVDVVAGKEVARLGHGATVRDDLEVGNRGQGRVEASEHQRMIVDKSDPNHHACQVTVTVIPLRPPSIVNSASIACARRSMDGVRSVSDRFKEFADLHAHIERLDSKEAERAARSNTRLIPWDLIGAIGETCEQLAAVDAAV